MPTIHVLDKAVAELIAAGEVVERPASIVKELVENAIDAGADQVTVEIEEGGIALIRVTDNGCGIPAGEMPKAFLRHATSKIQEAGDLDSILTLGFRGEALASIAAMSKVELASRPKDAPEGALCRAEGGEVFPVEPAACPDGTVITVRDVFYNTPARMKFLKKNVSEGSAVAQVVDKCALSHPEIAFQLRRDGKVTLRTSGGGDLLAVIYAIYGREFASHMTPVDYRGEEGISVKGYISKPGGVKPSRTYQSFFINSRYVRTRTGSAALEQAFKNKLMGGKFPACVLDIGLPPHVVDVNVHPAKIEVRFANEKPVFNAVYFAVKTALAKLDSPLQAGTAHLPEPEEADEELPFRSKGAGTPPQRMTAREFRVLFDPEEEGGKAFSSPVSLHSPTATAARARPDIFVEDPDPGLAYRADNGNKEVEPTTSDKISPAGRGTILEEPATIGGNTATNRKQPLFWREEEEPPVQTGLEKPPVHRLVGELFGTYILLEAGDSFLMVDKHAAHERILYEQLKETLSYGNRQVLLEPHTVTLSREDYAALMEYPEALDSLGFSVEDFGGSTVIVREVPLELAQGDVVYILTEVADKIKRNLQDLTPRVLDRLYYSIACRGAVKAGDRNKGAELEDIIRRLGENPQITHCPHGRPVSVTLTRYEIEKLFGRQG